MMWDSKVGGAATCLSEGTADVRNAVRETWREGGRERERERAAELHSLISRPDIYIFYSSNIFLESVREQQ